ncbi:hypothetical protein [Vulcanisaeta sp. JCM 16159]|uniref:hypothetical protein n=1 Tax=Vulcanisaeta sp. JCM 16159 TaxID=1295371 RepID=UPI000B307F5B|nr:hypothetical protein [Vulcanisaeta sp. JCM 16159]
MKRSETRDIFLKGPGVNQELVLVLIDLDGTLLPLEAWDPVFQEISMRIAGKANVDWRIIYRAAKDLNKELMRKFTIRLLIGITYLLRLPVDSGYP